MQVCVSTVQKPSVGFVKLIFWLSFLLCLLDLRTGHESIKLGQQIKESYVSSPYSTKKPKFVNVLTKILSKFYTGKHVKCVTDDV